MAGTILENLSTRKMLLICSVLLTIEVVCVLIGSQFAPKPSMVHHQLAKFCKDTRKIVPKSTDRLKNQWFLPGVCSKLLKLENADTQPEQVVFSLKIPRNNLAMSRWFQYMLTMISLRTKYHQQVALKNDSHLTMNVRVGYSNDENAMKSPEAWKELFSGTIKRKLECTFSKPLTEESHGFEYDCDLMHFFQLGSVPHKYYLVNVNLPSKNVNRNIGRIENMEFVTITQTGGFTQVWISLKCVMSVILLAPLYWYWNRIQGLQRKSSLLERVIFGLALSMEFLNLPIELLTIFCHADWMLVFVDLRQGLVYVVLLCFWVIFVGEHLMDQAHRNKTSSYKWHLSCICIATLSMLSFELAERGMQIINPTATIWNNHSTALALLIVGAICAVIYIIMLAYLIIRVIRSIRYKRRFSLPDERRKRFERIVKRFYILLFFTFATALVTVVFFFYQNAIGRMIEEWFAEHFQSAAGFHTGVYGLWNIYVTVVLWLYAPSHKFYEDGQDEREYLNGSVSGSNGAMTEQIQLMSMTQDKQAED